LIASRGADVGIDWHGHRDRGLDLANTLAAVEAGASRVHGTALGIGERVGNTPVEQLLVNFRLLGIRNNDLTRLAEYVEAVSLATGVPVPVNAPVVGRDAFRTATGVHAAAIIKAQKKGHGWLADRIYSGVPAGWVGRCQEVEIGPMSGNSNVIYYLASRGIECNSEMAKAILAEAKESPRLLTREEVLAAFKRARAAPADK
jgi:2-isopropylmalate synthase